jgi:hypothetical protein
MTNDTIKALKEALEFYACPSDYVSPYTGGLGKLYFDCGEKAKSALALITQLEAEAQQEWGDRPDEYTPEIDHARLTLSKRGDHENYAKAFALVGNRHSKFALVHLVYWLLTKAEAVKPVDIEPIAKAMWQKSVDEAMAGGRWRGSAPVWEEVTPRVREIWRGYVSFCAQSFGLPIGGEGER